MPLEQLPSMVSNGRLGLGSVLSHARLDLGLMNAVPVGETVPDTLQYFISSALRPRQMKEKELDTRCRLPCIFGAPLSNAMEKEAVRSPSRLPCFFLAGPLLLA